MRRKLDDNAPDNPNALKKFKNNPTLQIQEPGQPDSTKTEHLLSEQEIIEKHEDTKSGMAAKLRSAILTLVPEAKGIYVTHLDNNSKWKYKITGTNKGKVLDFIKKSNIPRSSLLGDLIQITAMTAENWLNQTGNNIAPVVKPAKRTNKTQTINNSETLYNIPQELLQLHEQQNSQQQYNNSLDLQQQEESHEATPKPLFGLPKSTQFVHHFNSLDIFNTSNKLKKLVNTPFRLKESHLESWKYFITDHPTQAGTIESFKNLLEASGCQFHSGYNMHTVVPGIHFNDNAIDKLLANHIQITHPQPNPIPQQHNYTARINSNSAQQSMYLPQNSIPQQQNYTTRINTNDAMQRIQQQTLKVLTQQQQNYTAQINNNSTRHIQPKRAIQETTPQNWTDLQAKMEEQKEERFKTFLGTNLQFVTCFLTGQIMQDPFTGFDIDGNAQTCERLALKEWVNEFKTLPATGKEINLSLTMPNQTLKIYIQQARKAFDNAERSAGMIL
jgi:hypothetical protein